MTTETKVKQPDGSVVTVRHPDNAAPEQILEFAKRNFKPKKETVATEQPVAEQPVAEEPKQEPFNVTPTVFESFKKNTREAVESLPGVAEFGTEITPTLALTGAGAAAGAPLGPLGMMAGGSIGGLLGEFFAQETGIAPESDLAMVATGVSPFLGPLLGVTFKGGRFLAGKGITALPPAATALARKTAQKAVSEFESIGTKIYAKQRGLLSQSAARLFAAAGRKGPPIPSNQLTNTQRVLSAVDQELDSVSAFPSGQQARLLLDRLQQTLGQGPISFDDFLTARQQIGLFISKAEREAGVKLGASKRLYRAMSEDLEQIVSIGKSPKASKEAVQRGKQAKIGLAAGERAKLEFAIKDVEQGIAQFTTDVAGTADKTINVAGFQKWLSNVTNPKHKKYDKNLSDALKDVLPEIQERLSVLAKITERSGSPAGPGSIVIRGIGSRTGRAIIGGLVGGSTGNPVIAGAGALIGASFPEIFVGLLSSKTGFALLERASRLGKGTLPTERWINLAQFITQAAQTSEDEKEEQDLDQRHFQKQQ